MKNTLIANQQFHKCICVLFLWFPFAVCKEAPFWYRQMVAIETNITLQASGWGEIGRSWCAQRIWNSNVILHVCLCVCLYVHISVYRCDKQEKEQHYPTHREAREKRTEKILNWLKKLPIFVGYWDRSRVWAEQRGRRDRAKEPGSFWPLSASCPLIADC